VPAKLTVGTLPDIRLLRLKGTDALLRHAGVFRDRTPVLSVPPLRTRCTALARNELHVVPEVADGARAEDIECDERCQDTAGHERGQCSDYHLHDSSVAWFRRTVKPFG